LIINTNENITFHLIPIHSTIHTFSPIVIVPMFDQLFSKITCSVIILILFKWNGLMDLAIQTSLFPSQWFDQHSDRHSTWKRIWVYDNIRSNSWFWKWHINLWQQHWQHSFLSMSWWKLISNNWISIVPVLQSHVHIVCAISCRIHHHLNNIIIIILNGSYFVPDLCNSILSPPTSNYHKLRIQVPPF